MLGLEFLAWLSAAQLSHGELVVWVSWSGCQGSDVPGGVQAGAAGCDLQL